jgi:hypothetical protein
MWALPATAELLPAVMRHLMQLNFYIWHLPRTHANIAPRARLLGRLILC